MPRAITTYGPHQRRLFRRLDKLGVIDSAGFAEELSFRAGREISPVNITHWRNGTSHLPMDCLPALAEFIDDSGSHDGVQLVFGPMLRDLGFAAVPAEKAAAPVDPQVALHCVMAETSDVMSCVVAAMDPDGPKGAAIDREEAARLKQELAELRRRMDELDAHCDDVLAADAKVRRLG